MDPSSNMNDSVASASNCEFDPQLFKAAIEGDIKPFRETNKDLNLIVTPTKNTVLHTHIMSLNQTQKSTEFVKQILEICPLLLLQVNINGDTPLHVAVRTQNSAPLVKVLIECSKAQNVDLERTLEVAKQMLSMTNKEGNTALHEAVRSAPLDVVKMLTKEAPEFSYSANVYGESPLYIAAAERFVGVVAEILDTCKLAAHRGPDGMTALHAAVRTNNLATVKKILENKKNLAKEADQNGWTPLHYAAYYNRSLSIVEQLLETDKSTAYAADKVRKMTALHMAASQGHKDIMEAIMSHCPDCYEMVDDKGWNVLHFAMMSLSVNELKSFLKKFSAISLSPVVRKDVKGNTPLHVLAACRPDSYTEVMKEYGIYTWLVNKQNDAVGSILSYGSEELEQEIKKLSTVVDNGPYRRGIVRRLTKWDSKALAYVEKAKESHLVVAALIATVTFAAAFTMPGGYKNEEGQDQGNAILTKKAAFQAFVITDATAMMLSLFSVFVHFVVSVETSDFMSLYDYGAYSTVLAMVAMVVAFVTGTYAVLTPSLGLAIATCLIGLSFFILVFWLFYKIGERNLDSKP